MALIRPVPTDHGSGVEYWRIEKIEDDLAQRRLEFLLRGYVNEAARRAGSEPVFEYPLVLIGAAYAPTPGLTELYERVKLHPGFAEAKDA
jgi:hypothetical protein